VLLAATFCCVAATSSGYGAAAGQALASQMPEQARVAAGTVAKGGLRQSPTVQFTPFPIEHGQAEKVSGDGFDPEVSCQILVDEVVQTEATCEVSGDGQVSGRFLAPGTGDTVSVWVCQADPSAEVPDPCGLSWAGGDGFRMVDPRPEITVTPGQARPGDSVKVVGLDFLPDRVTLTAPGVSVDVDSQPWGSFQTQLPIPADTQPGPFKIQGCSGSFCADSIIVIEPPIIAESSSPGQSPTTGGPVNPIPGTKATTQPTTPTGGTPTTPAPGTTSPPTSSTDPVPTGTQTTPPGGPGSANTGGWRTKLVALIRDSYLPVLLVVLAVVLGWLAALALQPRRRARRWTRRHVKLASRLGGVSVLSLDPPGGTRLPVIRLVPRPDISTPKKGRQR